MAICQPPYESFVVASSAIPLSLTPSYCYIWCDRDGLPHMDTVSTPLPKAAFILVYGIQPKHWMPAYAGMTIKRSFPCTRESRSRTYNVKPRYSNTAKDP